MATFYASFPLWTDQAQDSPKNKGRPEAPSLLLLTINDYGLM